VYDSIIENKKHPGKIKSPTAYPRGFDSRILGVAKNPYADAPAVSLLAGSGSTLTCRFSPRGSYLTTPSISA